MIQFNGAGVAELADALDLGSSAERHAGSTPVTRTKLEICLIQFVSNFFYFEDREYTPLFHFRL